jgi:hypothetical protein
MDVSEERIASILRMEELAKHDTSKKYEASKALRMPSRRGITVQTQLTFTLQP